MNAVQDSFGEVLELTCSQPDGRRLRELVERLRSRATGNEGRIARLDDFLGRLDGANSLAHWLRDIVRLDVPRYEACELLSAWQADQPAIGAVDATQAPSLENCLAELMRDLSSACERSP